MREGMKICDHCKGNGYTKVYDMIVQCDTCKSQGEVKYRPTEQELKELVKQAGLQRTIKIKNHHTIRTKN